MIVFFLSHMHLLGLPNDAQAHLFYHLDARTLSAAEQCCQSMQNISRQDNCHAWHLITQQRWGPVRLPGRDSWCTSTARRILPIWDGPEEPPADWRQLLAYLETVVRTWLCVSVKKAVDLLKMQGIVRAKTTTDDDDGAWHESLRRLLTWVPLNEKRRITAFCCADWQTSTTLSRFLGTIPIVGPNPVVALRTLLLRFPFLPIDAGMGADRVIGCFARAYVLQNADCLHTLGLGTLGGSNDQATGQAPAMAALTANTESDSDSDQEGGAAIPTAEHLLQNLSAMAATIGLSADEHKAARDAVYTLIYSVIMLNTDLHNPAILPKIQPAEYVRSVHRCVPLAHVPDDMLLAIYEGIATHPLQIAPSIDKVATTIRCSQVADDTESGPTYSVYSALPQRVAAAAAGVAANAPSVVAGNAWATTSGGAVVIGGGAAGLNGAAAAELPAVNWTVAYWNLLDGCRYLRRKAMRILVPAPVAWWMPTLWDHLERMIVRMAPIVCAVALAWQVCRLLGLRA